MPAIIGGVFGRVENNFVVTLQLQQSFSRACLNRDHDRAVQNNRNNQSAGNINRLLHETAQDVGKPSSEGEWFLLPSYSI